MKIVLQRVKEAEVTVSGSTAGKIGRGIMVLVGVTHDDAEQDAVYLAEKLANLRIFEDESGKMNRSILDEKGEVLSVSQFTLYGECRKGRRPNFMGAAKPDAAEPLYEKFNQELRKSGLTVETGVFGSMMDVSLINEGPVTLIIDSADRGK
ncbi:D-tyrosyl-tRNA(Tyr) deacylase [Bacillus sp. FJAT-42376]|uniref:D-aminoacyl-tRNA deacylase n=1 Tax=Bacillus sp. FJAT-42376 TaxID=2014076 RepID=UPI000F4DBB15|nr:D-aminoacyl-tRNA deacylase [Bacillus sp. FJAT-42376]AZB43739.1 D-tyrosyl-tRNA(Tyr) deacylase [Bacillus sp. FJAT-42376]